MKMPLTVFLLIVSLCPNLFASPVATAPPDTNVTWEYWDAAKTRPKNVQVIDSQGRQHGEQIYWYENGMMSTKVSFKHGELLLCEGWFDNGEKRYQQPFADATGHGLWIWWDRNGNVLARSDFNHGTGVEYYFDDTGKEKKRVVWVGGTRVSPVTPVH